MDLHATLGPPEWDELEQMRGVAAMAELSDWMTRHIGLPLRWRAERGDEAVIVGAASITAGHLVCRLRQVRVTSPKHVEYLGPWETKGFELECDPPFWVNPRISFHKRTPKPPPPDHQPG